MDQATALEEVGKIGQAFANDLDDVLDGKFGFHVEQVNEIGDWELVATFEPCLPEDAPRGENNSDYGPKQTFRWVLSNVPTEPDQVLQK